MLVPMDATHNHLVKTVQRRKLRRHNFMIRAPGCYFKPVRSLVGVTVRVLFYFCSVIILHFFAQPCSCCLIGNSSIQAPGQGKSIQIFLNHRKPQLCVLSHK